MIFQSLVSVSNVQWDVQLVQVLNPQVASIKLLFIIFFNSIFKRRIKNNNLKNKDPV